MLVNNKTANDTVIKTVENKVVVRNELDTTQEKELDHMMQKEIVDKFSKIVTLFVIFADSPFTVADWVPKDKFISILAELDGKTSVNYQLKGRSIADGMKKAQDGKALKIALSDSDVKISIHMLASNAKKDDWRLSHTYRIDRKIFDAYVLVVSNDMKAAKLEQDYKNKANTSLDLG